MKMKVDLFTIENEPSRSYKLLKSVELPFAPAQGAVYIDGEVSYDVKQVVFTDSKTAVILTPSEGDSEAINMIAQLF